MDGSPSVLEEVVYSDNQRVEVLLTEPLRTTPEPGDFTLVDDSGNTVSDVTIDRVSLINSSSTIAFWLTGRRDSGDIIIRRTADDLIGSNSGLAMGLVEDVATISMFDSEVPRIVTASFIDNNRVVMEFSDAVYAVSIDDFILEVRNSKGISGAEVMSLTHPAVGVAGGAPSSSVVALALEVTGTNIRPTGQESLRIRLERYYALDIAAFYDGSEAPRRAATHQVETDALPFENPNAPRLLTAAIDATNTTLTLTFDRNVEYVGTDLTTDFTFDVTPGPTGRTHRITAATVTGVSTDTNSLMLGLQTTPPGGRSTVGEDSATITIATAAVADTGTVANRLPLHPGITSLEFTFNDTEAPEVASIEVIRPPGITTDRDAYDESNNTYTARWRVTFTESVTGVNRDDFSICIGDSDDGFSTRCETIVSTGAVTVSADSNSVYTVTGNGLVPEVGRNIDYLLRLNASGSGIVDSAVRGIPDSASAEGGVFFADDAIPPQVQDVAINSDNTLLTVTFSELISQTRPVGGLAITVALSTDSEWVTDVNRGSIARGPSSLTVPITLVGPEPLNGMSPNGGEVLEVTIAENAVGDLVSNRNASTSVEVTFNEVAAPQIRAGSQGFGANGNVTITNDDMVNIGWRVRFTETVRTVTTASFTLLEVTDPATGTSRAYTASTYVDGSDSFALGDTSKFSVSIAADSSRTNVGADIYADTYEVMTNGLRLLNSSSDAIARYVLRMTDSTPALQDDDGRDLTGLPRVTPVQAASTDVDPPVLTGATLDATNTTLTLTFNEDDRVAYTGTDFGTDFTLTGVSNLAAGGTQWIVTATVAAPPVIIDSQTMALRIATQGPAPLNGRSAEGGERWQIDIAADSISDRPGNRLQAASEMFTFNDNAGPEVYTIRAMRLSRTPGSGVRWRVRYTEPVSGATWTDHQLYLLPGPHATSLTGVAGTRVFRGSISGGRPQNGNREYHFELTPASIPEAVGADTYYALSTARLGGNRTDPDFAAAIYRHEDLTPPRVIETVVSADNNMVTFTFSENIELTTQSENFISDVVVATSTVTSSAADLSADARTGVLNEWIAAIPTVSTPVVSGDELSLALAVTGIAPLSGEVSDEVPVEGPGYLAITLPDLITDVVDGVARNSFAETRIEATLNNEALPQVREIATTSITENTDKTYDASWRVTFTEPVDGVAPDDFYVEMDDASDFASASMDNDAEIRVENPVSAFREYTVTAKVSTATVTTYYRLRLTTNAMVAERERGPVARSAAVTDAAILAAGNIGVHEARDNVGPEVIGVMLGSDNTTLSVTFNEELGAVDMSEITITPFGTPIWVSTITVGEVSTSSTILNIALDLTGPAPLNGMSPEGSEEFDWVFAEGTVSDAEGNPSDSYSERLTLNEVAAPQVRAGDAGFMGVRALVAMSGITADFTWRIRFTEPVNGVDRDDFTLITVPGDDVSLGTTYTGVEYSRDDDMTVSLITTPGTLDVLRDTYTIVVTGLTSTNVLRPSPNLARYALLVHPGATVTDTNGRSLVGLPRYSGYLDAVRDSTPPMFMDASLNADNTTLTLNFDEPVRYTGSDSNSDFSITVAGTGVYASVTGASVTTVLSVGDTLQLTIQGLGPEPLNGLSAVGGEVGTVSITRASVVDVADNALSAASPIMDTFTFSDNAAPRLESVGGNQPSQPTAGAAVQITWQVVFTEPVSGVDAADFSIYRLPASDSPIAAESRLTNIAGLSPTVTRSDDATYDFTVTIPEPVGEHEYYTVSLADGNNIAASAGSSRGVPAEGRNAPDAATFVATLRDISPPTVSGSPLLSDDNSVITYTFNENVQLAGTAAGLANAVFVPRQSIPNSNGVNRNRVLGNAISRVSITDASVSGTSVRLTVSIDGTVTIPAPDYLSIIFPGGQIEDRFDNVFPGGAAPDRFSLADAAQPAVVGITTTDTAITRNVDNTYTADWSVTFTEPVAGVTTSSFSICMVAAAADECASGTVLSGAVGSVTAEADSDFLGYTVNAPALAQQTGSTWYRLRLDSNPGITERLGAGRALSTSLPLTGEAHRVDDTIGPVAQSDGLSIISTTAMAHLSVRFSEELGAVNPGNISVALSDPRSEWITGATVSGASFDAATLTVVITTTGTAPLNGLSPNGGEGITLMLGGEAVHDESDNPSVAANLQFTLNENAAPRVRAGGITGQSGVVMEDGGSRTADLEWTIVFTETVRGVNTGSFELLRVTGTTTSPVDLSARTFTVTTSGNANMSDDGRYADRYTVLTNADAGEPGEPARYILRFEDTAVQDDEGRLWGGERSDSAATSVDDRVPPEVDTAEATAGTEANQIRITVTFNEALSATSVTRISSQLSQFATGRLDNPDAPYATVSAATLIGAESVPASNNQLAFTARLASSLDGHESAVGVEQFTFTIPAGLLVDNSANSNATTMPTPFTITVPESGAPEVAGFSVVSSIEDPQDSNSGLFNISYLVEFTEPVSFANTDTAFVLYQVAALELGNGPTVQSALSSPARITASPTVAPMGTEARYLVTYTGVQRPPSNVRGYVAFLDDSGVTDAASRTLEDCSYSDSGATGCLSAFADASDTVPPKFAALQAGFADGQSSLWMTFNEPISVPGGSDGSLLPGFTVERDRSGGPEIPVAAARYRPALTVDGTGSVELRLSAAITAATVFVTYQPPSSGLAVHDNARALGLNAVPNRAVSLGPIAVMRDAARDLDGDGVPDYVEAGVGANPYALPDNDPRAQNLPELSLTRGDNIVIAYSGIRAAGIFGHLGLSVTPASAAARTMAYYQRRNNAPCPIDQILTGNCTLVDFSNIPAATDIPIVWVATNETGYPVTAAQVIRRVPELNMAKQRLFFLAGDSAASTVAIAATLDIPVPASPPTLVVTPALTISGLAGTVANSAVSGTSQTYTIAGLMSGGADVLWRVGSSTAALVAESYSLGLVLQTQVVRLGNNFLPPLLGQPTLTDDAGGSERHGLTGGDFTVTLPVENATAVPTVTEQGASVLSSIVPGLNAAGDAVTVMFTVPMNARSDTKTSVGLRILVPGRGPSTSSLVVTWPLVASGSPLAGVTSDTDSDGIPDSSGADLYVGDSALPVAVVSGGREVAGRAPWHHIRAGLPLHRMCVGDLTLRYGAEAEMPFDSYDDWAASFSTAELMTVGVGSPAQPLSTAYNFRVCGVDYDTMGGSTVAAERVLTGGHAVVVIPLPESIYDVSGLGLYKYTRATGAWQPINAPGADIAWGFEGLQNGVCMNSNEVPLRSIKQSGDACLVVRIRDGGRYDNDGSVNGVIDDPLGIGAAGRGAVGAGGGGGGGSVGLIELFGILFFVAALLLRQRRRRAVDA